MKTKWTGPYTIVEVSAMGSINLRINVAIFWTHSLLPKASEKYFQMHAHKNEW